MHTDRNAAAAAVALLREFVVKVEQLAETETREWAERFRARIDSFDTNPNLKVRLDTRDRSEPPASGSTPAADTQRHGRGESDEKAAAATQSHVTGLIRVVIEDVASLDPGSLQLSVDAADKAVPENGDLMLPLELGISHRYRYGHAGRAAGARRTRDNACPRR